MILVTWYVNSFGTFPPSLQIWRFLDCIKQWETQWLNRLKLHLKVCFSKMTITSFLCAIFSRNCTKKSWAKRWTSGSHPAHREQHIPELYGYLYATYFPAHPEPCSKPPIETYLPSSQSPKNEETTAPQLASQ